MLKFKIIAILFSFSILLFTSVEFLFSQDALVYYEGLYYNGPYIPINIGETKYAKTDGDECCVLINNPNAAVKVTAYEKLGARGWYPVNFFFYTEKNFPEVFGTDQYENVRIKIECLQKASTYQQLPQPEVFIPFDSTSTNRHGENDSYLMPFVPENRMLVLRRAFIWENSEGFIQDFMPGDWHGPYGDVKIGVYESSVIGIKEDGLIKNNSLWVPKRKRQGDLSGPIWGGYSAAWPFLDPYDEWIDGPFGCIYSNIALWNWGRNPNPSESVAIIICEADDPDSFMGISDHAIKPFDEGLILIKVWGFGWVVLENIWVPSSGKEPNVAQGDVYWYGGWDGKYPVDVYGPTNPAVPNQDSYGSQFKPFTDELFWKFHNDSRFDGYKVGLLGNKFPKGVYNRPRTYMLIDKDKPAVFGQ